MWGERTVEVPWMLSKVLPGTVIDIGSAESCYVEDLVATSEQVTLNDVRYFTCPDFGGKVRCIVGDIRKLLPDHIGKFDNLLCISTLEHIALESYGQAREVPGHHSAYYPQREAFAHMMKFVKPGGQGILTVPYGKYEDGGWVIVYDEGMINELKAAYDVVEETYFKLIDRERDTWVKCAKHECTNLGMDHYDGNMRANNVCCLVLKNKE